MHRTTIIELYM